MIAARDGAQHPLCAVSLFAGELYFSINRTGDICNINFTKKPFADILQETGRQGPNASREREDIWRKRL